jgi:hypothetical protein
MYKLERIPMFILNEVETSHILISIRLYFILTILITEDGPQPSILSDCKFNSSAGEVSDTQAGLWGGLSRYIDTGPGEPRKGTWISEEPHWHFWFLHYYLFCIFNSNLQFWEKFQSVLGPQSNIVPPCKISLGDPGTKCWQFTTFCNGPAGSPSGNFSPGIL